MISLLEWQFMGDLPLIQASAKVQRQLLLLLWFFTFLTEVRQGARSAELPFEMGYVAVVNDHQPESQ